MEVNFIKFINSNMSKVFAFERIISENLLTRHFIFHFVPSLRGLACVDTAHLGLHWPCSSAQQPSWPAALELDSAARRHLCLKRAAGLQQRSASAPTCYRACRFITAHYRRSSLQWCPPPRGTGCNICRMNEQ